VLDSDDPIGGHGMTVEVDETHVGGRARGTKGGRYAGNKAIVLGMMEKGGELVTRVVPSVKRCDLVPLVQQHVLPGSNVHTDALQSYRILKDYGYRHEYVRHDIGQYVGKTGCTVNRLEGFCRDLAQSGKKVKALELTGEWADVRDPEILARLNSKM
jgi:transposase-like protein